MGDGALSPTRSGHGARFRWGHGAAAGRVRRLEGDRCSPTSTVCRSTNAKGAVFHDVQPLPELAELRQAVYVGGKKVLSDDYLKALTPLSLAIWYMDDGGFTLRTEGHAGAHPGRQRPVGDLRARPCRAGTRTAPGRLPGRHLGHPGQAHRAGRPADVRPACSPRRRRPSSTPSSLRSSTRRWQYKLLPEVPGSLRGRAGVRRRSATSWCRCRSLDIDRKPRSRQTHRFDIEVEGSHNYFVDGVMVHNSPGDHPGWSGAEVLLLGPPRHPAHRVHQGRRRGGRQPHPGQGGEEQVRRRRSARPSSTSCTARGISREGSVLDIGVDLGFIKKSGAWYTYEGEQLGQGRENAKEFLTENAEIMVEISERIRTEVGIGDAIDLADGEADRRRRRRSVDERRAPQPRRLTPFADPPGRTDAAAVRHPPGRRPRRPDRAAAP